MNNYCGICDGTIELISKNNHLKPHTHIQIEKCIQINHTFKDFDFFDMD